MNHNLIISSAQIATATDVTHAAIRLGNGLIVALALGIGIAIGVDIGETDWSLELPGVLH